MAPKVGQHYFSTINPHTIIRVDEVLKTAVSSQVVRGPKFGVRITDDLEAFDALWETCNGHAR
jgi:hypothetical protein